MHSLIHLLVFLILLPHVAGSDFDGVFVNRSHLTWNNFDKNCDTGDIYLVSSEHSYQSTKQLDSARFKLHLARTESVQSGTYGKTIQSGAGFQIDISLKVLSDLIKGPLQLVAYSNEGRAVCQTRVQAFDVLDEFSTEKALGPVFLKNQIMIKLWAPTARRVSLLLEEPRGTRAIPMQSQFQNGIYKVSIPRRFENSSYGFEVEVFVPDQNRIRTYTVTDPYSTALTVDSQKSVLVDLDKTEHFPPGFKDVHPTREVQGIYELHVRDFSIEDSKVPFFKRGTYGAFCSYPSHGTRHLRTLAKNGMSHLHLLPVFDFASVEEHKTPRVAQTFPVYSPDSEEPSYVVESLNAQDGFNWGYDPYHYGVPEGSYATNPHGANRVLEFRAMVQCLNRMGLSLVMDVVYNHTHANGDHPKSVLDKVVPGYFYRHDFDLNVEQSTCCPDTESQRKMMEKLIVDTILRFARDYKVAGFRFDLMGHHTRSNLQKVRKKLDSLTLEKDGINGQRILLYGEGWSFGSMQARSPGEAMNQINAVQSGVATFNDRMRDALRGGNFMHSSLRDPGFASGVAFGKGTDRAKNLKNIVKNSLLGALSDSGVENPPGEKLPYHGNPPAGYALEPKDVVQYVSAHDNYTLFDQIQAKAPFHCELPCRVRMQSLALSVIALSQGIPFYHAGSEFLRSKSGDGDSYNSSDHFNALDFSFRSGKWGVGLPVASKNKAEWPIWKALFKKRDLNPRALDRHFVFQRFLEMTSLRSYYKEFFSLSSSQIRQRAKFIQSKALGVILLDLSTPYGEPGLFIAMNSSDKFYDGKLPLGYGKLANGLERRAYDECISRQGKYRIAPLGVCVYQGNAMSKTLDY